MHSCIISLAANHAPEEHLAEARRHLGQVLTEPRYTRELWTAPMGHAAASAPPYLNQLVSAQTMLDAQQLQQALKAIEADMGRTAADREQGIVRIDLDLMSHDGVRHHLRDWSRPYILQLLPELPTL